MGNQEYNMQYFLPNMTPPPRGQLPIPGMIPPQPAPTDNSRPLFENNPSLPGIVDPGFVS